MIPQIVRDDFVAMNELITKQVPSLDLEKIQQNLIKQNEHYLKLDVNYDEKYDL